MRIAFFDTKKYDSDSFSGTNKNYGFEIKYFKSHLTIDNALLTRGFNVVCVFVNDTIDEDVLNILIENGVELIALRCAGYNNVDISYAYEKIHVVRVPAYSPYAVAEHAAALILSLNRKIHKAYSRTRESNFNIAGLEGFDLHGKTAGVIGAGKIGRIMIGILKGFGMNLLVFDHYKDQEYAKAIGFKYAELDEIFGESDIITLHCPLTAETHHMINKESIKKMKEGVMLINTSRGHLIDTKSLIKGLKSGKIGSAGLDVYEEEANYFFEDFSGSMVTDDQLARLLTFNNVIVTSHQAFLTTEALSNIASTTLGNIKEYFDGGPLVNEICYKCGKDCLKKRGERCF
ncbi:MAG: 2-hydroxyacid dehydrogenase [Spirochaetales bacterium]|nr:2-hydroxyacid dehydrogenase [Spirochaetales bacterium]